MFNPNKVTSNFAYQDGYQTTLSSAITASDLAIPLTALPDGTEGTLVIDAGTSSEEEIYFNSQGAGVVNCPSATLGRGINGTTAVAHNSGATVKMLITKASLDVLKNMTAMSSNILAGWISSESETWTYANWSDNKGTVTVPGDLTSKYSIGDKVRLKQGGSYIYLTMYANPTYSSPNTTLYLCGDSSGLAGATNYFTNAPITDNYYSKSVNPVGHPDWFLWSPTINGSGGSIGTFATNQYHNKYSIHSRTVNIQCENRIFDKGSWSGDLQISMPIALSANYKTNTSYLNLLITATTAVPIAGSKACAQIPSASATFLKFVNSLDASALQWSGVAVNDVIHGDFTYEI